ncbi:hypothetical protein J6590_023744 [Homalodisca vitripennis]|nr:hypothetical protein J6590_023744 [Homalodisca vitripennis]
MTRARVGEKPQEWKQFLELPGPCEMLASPVITDGTTRRGAVLEGKACKMARSGARSFFLWGTELESISHGGFLAGTEWCDRIAATGQDALRRAILEGSLPTVTIPTAKCLKSDKVLTPDSDKRSRGRGRAQRGQESTVGMRSIVARCRLGGSLKNRII